MSILFCSVVLLVAAAPVNAQTGDLKPLTVHVEHAVVSLLDQAEVAAKRPGVLKTYVVAEGDMVKAGDELAQLDDEEAQLALRVAEGQLQSAQHEAKSDIHVREATAAAEFARTEYIASRDVHSNAPDAISANDLRRLYLAYQRGALAVDQAKHDHEQANITAAVHAAQVESARHEVSARRIVSPLDGMVVRLHRHAGEWIDDEQPICHVVRLDRLRVTGFVNVRECEQAQVKGQPATITVKLQGGRQETFEGVIGFASPLVQPDGHYRIWAEVANRQRDGYWVLRPGLVAEMEVELGRRNAEPVAVK